MHRDFPAPTMSTAVMALQVRALAWQCFVYNYTHYLIWDVVTPGNGRSGYGYGSWNGGSFFYTAPYGYDQSTRLELIREGFEDYEYFTLLAKTIDKLKATDPNDPHLATGEQMLEQVEALFNATDMTLTWTTEWEPTTLESGRIWGVSRLSRNLPFCRTFPLEIIF